MQRKLDRVGASMYLSEVRELIDSQLFCIQSMEAARNRWVDNEHIASEQATASDPENFSHSIFNDAIRGTSTANTEIFDSFEALLSAWARLSLLFFPARVKGAEGKWRQERGRTLQTLFELPGKSLLEKRSFRDSWMHFDERLDAAFLEGWLGNRQQFTRTAGVLQAVKHSIRVIDVEGLAFHYRLEDGSLESVAVADMKALLSQLVNELPRVGPRIVKLLPPPA